MGASLAGSEVAAEGALSSGFAAGVSVAAVAAGAAGVVPGGVRAGRRRMEKRVTARTKARARARRPTREAPRTDAPSGRAVVSATGRPLITLGVVEPADGWSVGNRLPALPPGLSVGLSTAETPGRSPTGSGDVVVSGDIDGVADAVALGDEDGVVDEDGVADEDAATVPEIWTVADDDGSLDRPAALPITVSLTDVIVEAVVGTVDSACNWR